MKISSFILSILTAFSFILVSTGCGNHKEQSSPEASNPHTGNEVFEPETISPDEAQNRNFEILTKSYFVTTSRLVVRSAALVSDDNSVGALALNDEVKVISLVDGTDFVQIEVVKTNQKLKPSEAYFVAKDYLSGEINQARAQQLRNRYFVVVNVATEILRVYEKQCEDGRCAHKMILQTDVAVGEKTKDRERMTVLGSFNVTKWVKFYQDNAGLYPSWFDPSYPEVPKPGAGVLRWTKKDVLPNGKGQVRGAFGWFTAMVGPDSHQQWTHGTLGWGVDKKKYIKTTRSFWANLITTPRSHGCTRTDNESIAYIRNLVEEGTPLIKIYAVEKLQDSDLANYGEKTLSWDYILTNNGVRVNGEKPDRAEVLASGTPKDQWLEEGTYQANIYPSVKNFSSGKVGAKSSKNGNVYGLKESEMKGMFYVDSGILVDYSHPATLDVGGYGRDSLPAFMLGPENP